MQENEKKYMELANRIYDLDTEVYDRDRKSVV